jgi:hypothetical protein
VKFSEIVDQASDLLRRKGRVTYRALKLEFGLDEDQLDVLKEELIDGQRVAIDEGGKVLVWVGEGSLASSVQSLESNTVNLPDVRHQTLDPRPVSYTPPHLAERIRAEQAAMEARGATDGERKTITALFADLKGSTALIEGLDPEEARAIIDPALQVMMDAVHRYDGYVAQALGDGIFALFGAPLAHEDHPQRALYAALRMQEEMRRYADALRSQGYPPLLMRVGVNTGEVGDGLIGHPVWSVEWALGQAQQSLAVGAARAGRDPSTIHFQPWVSVSIDRDPKVAVNDAKPEVAFYGGIAQYHPFFAAHGFGSEACQLQEAEIHELC